MGHPSAQLLVLQWCTPYTWPGYDVTAYAIVVQDTESGVLWGNFSINATACVTQEAGYCRAHFDIAGSRNTTVLVNSSTVSLQLEPTDGAKCSQYLFTIAAANVVGWSNYSAVIVGFPEGELYMPQCVVLYKCAYILHLVYLYSCEVADCTSAS